MHPEVIQNTPGNCPKCGMALEPKFITRASEENLEFKQMKQRLWVCTALTAPIAILVMVQMFAHESFLSGKFFVWIELILATPVVLWGGFPFFERAKTSVLNKSLNMFTLIALGTGTAYFYSVVATLMPKIFPENFKEPNDIPVYFEAAAIIITLVLMGQVIELHARSKTGNAIRALLKLAPKNARKIFSDGHEKDIPVSHLHVGDRIRIRPGESIPVDGLVLEGKSLVDESMMTGEAIPVEKEKNSILTGGTVNKTGSLIMEAKKVGADTVLSQIINMVNQAQRSRAPIQNLVDQISAYFVPAVILTAVLTFIIWFFIGPEPRMAYAIVNAVSVLIIACPCALGLATPMSIMVGVGRAAQFGILVKNAEVLQTFERINVLVIDKTGTLTEGKPKLIDIISLDHQNKDEILRFAASLEQNSEHPLAHAIVSAATDRNLALLKVKNFNAVTGKGIVGTIGDSSVMLGNQKLLEDSKIDTNLIRDEAERLRREGETVMFLVINGKLSGFIGVADPIKPTTQRAIEDLSQDVDLILVTGDNKTTAEAVARKLNLKNVYADILPIQKSEIVAKLQREGRLVAMAGDGINDAPALSQADVGIAMGTGTDVAMESAGIVLVKGDLRGIARAKHLSKMIMQNIRQNLFFAFIYNILGVSIAAGMLYPFFRILLNPAVAGMAMSFSSVSVILNSLRLNKVEAAKT